MLMFDLALAVYVLPAAGALWLSGRGKSVLKSRDGWEGRNVTDIFFLFPFLFLNLKLY